MRQPATIFEARNRRVPALKLPWTRRGQLKCFSPSDITEMRARAPKPSGLGKLFLHTLIAISIVLLPLYVASLIVRNDLMSIVVLGWLFLWTSITAFAFRGKCVPQMPPSDLTPLLLSVNRCPSCATSIEQYRTEPDGCSICAKCGSAWLLPPREMPEQSTPVPISIGCASATHQWFPFAAATADRTITDAKGQRVSLIPVIHRSRWPKHFTDSSWRACDHAAAWLAVPYIVLGYGVLVLLGIVTVGSAGTAAPSMLPVWFKLVLGAYILVAAYFIIGPPRDARHARAKLGAGHCPACAAKLDLNTLDAHGHHVCPTCAASWHPGDRKRIRLRPRLLHAPPVVTGDHRGIMHPIFDAEIFRPPGDTPQFLSRDEYRTLRKEFLATDWYATVNKILSILAIIWASSVIVDHIRQGRPPITFGVLLVFILIWTLRAWRGLGNDPRRLIDTLIGRNRCGSCGNDLAGLDVGEDGCTLCPECGAAWKLDTRSET